MFCAMLANECMKPAKLKRHFECKHKEYMGKPIGLFERKRDELKNHMTKEPSVFFCRGKCDDYRGFIRRIPDDPETREISFAW